MNRIICWWSGGITSAVACKLAIEKYGADVCDVIILDTQSEHEDTYRFMNDCSEWYSKPIEKWKSDKYTDPKDTWYKHLSLNTANGAVCSYMLKRRVREKWEKENPGGWTHQVFGFEFHHREKKRAQSLTLNHPQTKPLFPLIEAEMTKDDCIRYVREAGIKIPKAYELGFHNNNCLGGSSPGCTQGGIGYWQKIATEYPEWFEKRAKIEHDLTDLKGKPVTMLKDQSNAAKDSGNTLVFLKKHPDYPELKCLADMKGRPVEPLKECNGFCGVNDLVERSQTELELNYSLDS